MTLTVTFPAQYLNNLPQAFEITIWKKIVRSSAQPTIAAPIVVLDPSALVGVVGICQRAVLIIRQVICEVRVAGLVVVLQSCLPLARGSQPRM